ncbi:MAG: methyltransferase domain-containing protein [Syntrophomonadaceae bacterium]|nr:methyltransferase domain-containing protein [Syntrophomonadaceae bacterium]
MKYSKSVKYDTNFIKENIMGPNPMKLLEELLLIHPISSADTVLDLGCGRGVTSIFLVKEYQARVFAVDLWITPTENKRLFDEMGLTSQNIIPIKAEAHELPFAEEFFDTVICVDSYHYFGLDKEYLGKYLLPLIKHGGYLLVVVPGLKKDIHDNLPPEMLLSWSAEDIQTLHDVAYWKQTVEAAEDAEIVMIDVMEGFDECWNDWLACDNEYAVGDRKAMNAGAGKYMNFIAMIIRRK